MELGEEARGGAGDSGEPGRKFSGGGGRETCLLMQGCGRLPLPSSICPAWTLPSYGLESQARVGEHYSHMPTTLLPILSPLLISFLKII